MERQIINTSEAPAAIGPYSQAVVAGGMIFASGQIALNPQTGEMVQDNITNETIQVMENLGAILAAAGSSYDKIIKCTIFVKDLNNFGTINAIYGSFFKSNPPARETVEVCRLPKDANVEISAIALV